MSTFSGFSEEELNRIKCSETGTKSGNKVILVPSSKLKIGVPLKKMPITFPKQNSDDAIDNIQFDKCRLTLKPNNFIVDENKVILTNNNKENLDNNKNAPENGVTDTQESVKESINSNNLEKNEVISRKYSVETPDIVRGVDNYSEDELAMHKVKLEELQLRQKLMEEQNKKRKEMLAKALADRTKQTAEEVMKLEKIKKELQVLDGQFSQDVAVLRGKIDQACLSYADAEKHYLRVEKEFLQAKIHLQKEREKKELLTEHLCALITHNETRKAQKLETLMLELATDKKYETNEVTTVEDEQPVIVDGVDERTGKIVDITLQS